MSLPTSCCKPAKQDRGDLRKDVAITEHELSVEEVMAKYQITETHGLSGAQVKENRAKYGENRLTPPVIMPEWLLYILQYWNLFSLLLLAGGILCLVAYALDTSDNSNLYLGVVLVAVVVISSTFGYFQESKSAKIMEGFKNLVPKKCKCIRDGSTQILDASELVPGDVVEFQEGDQVPADVRVIRQTNLKVDNSSLTGESEAQERTVELQKAPLDDKGQPKKIPAIEACNLLFFSTIITAGFGKGVVVGTGDNTVMGQIAGLATETESKDALIVMDVNRFIGIISAIAFTIGALFLGISLGLGIYKVVAAIVLAISVIIATVPEGLLVTMTVSLALTAKRMHSKNVLVKNVQSVETLGSTSLIASDKTGTLTQNRMTVQHCWYDQKLCEVPAYKNYVARDQGWSAVHMGAHPHYDPKTKTFQYLHMVATLCNNSEFQVADVLDPEAKPIDLEKECHNPEFNLLGLSCTGDASESGLIKCVQMMGDIKTFRQAFPKLFEIKFNSTNKWQLSVHKPDPNNSLGLDPVSPLLVLKGAPEKVWALCSKMMIGGEVQPITKQLEQDFLKAYETLGSMGERVLGFAYRTLPDYDVSYSFNDTPEMNFPKDELIFVGLFALIDPPRQGVPEAVEKCKEASVRVFMVTGDHPITAQAIAKQVGIIDDAHLAAKDAAVVTGDDIRQWMMIEDPIAQQAKWDEALDHTQIVWARVTPAHKLLIVENAQRRGEIVSVTGDGVNDAPALKKGNVGIAMGISGKDVSKEAADLILMDDNFASIVNGVEEGRLIFDNLKKSIMYTLTSKPPELIPFIVLIAANFPPALSSILILAVDLGTDMVPAISLAYETREADIMTRPPRNPQKDKLVDGRLLNFSYFHLGILQACAGFFAFVVVMNDLGYVPGTLMGLGQGFDRIPTLCTINGDGAPSDCGFGCVSPPNQGLYRQQNERGAGFCRDGCTIPFPGTYDPFSEFTPEGFRGLAAGEVATCGRTCEWYRGLSAQDRTTYLEAARSNSSEFRYILTPQDVTLFERYCALPNAATYGFAGRGAFDKGDFAPAGAFYWWAGRAQLFPNLHYQQKTLHTAQSAYFVAVVLGKLMTVLTSKTRKLSLFQQGVMNNRFMLYGIVFTASLAVLLVYVPFLNTVFATAFLPSEYWLLGIPWCLLLFTYEETRKWFMRRFPGGFTERGTYW